MTLHSISPLMALIFGILILINPKLLSAASGDLFNCYWLDWAGSGEAWVENKAKRAE